MKLFSLFLLLFFTGASLAQDSTDVTSYSSELMVGELMAFGERSLRFKELISDSRCPTDVSCVWAGEAKVLVELYENGKLCGEEILVISGGGQASVVLEHLFSGAAYKLTGFNLQPYPETSVKIKPSDYTLSLNVTEKIKD
ncbi:hypothetical protein GCM10007103_28500 [Salinimicrobium marinum]|uniref:Uncharacterized protein n=1 Tax=Salinimicrobium marinum TaxID=680283 RepID=A0A918W0N0_9FLAO|nr:hypothetical protein [Salinimicrobium marinum]GHA45706.1 hypothetical protein GCM10007103_28500 [Salinimicrobium marinum]